MLVSLTVGKVDAGVAVLLTEDKRLVSLLYHSSSQLKHSPAETTIPRPIRPSITHILPRFTALLPHTNIL